MYRLIEIQKALKAPKNQRNSFGNYNYRSCEDILEAVKPLLATYKLALVIKDDIVAIDGRFYIKAIAQLFDDEGKEITYTTALAREEESKKGMDASQLTGSTSSYARKYALNGLFAIDDNKDADATNTHGKTQKDTKTEKTVEEKIQDIKDDAPIIAGIINCNTEDECIDYWNKNVGKLSGAAARKQLAERKRQRIEAIKEGN